MTMKMYKWGNQLESNSTLHTARAVVGVIMGSRSDWLYIKPCCCTLEELHIPFEYGVISAHRTPNRMCGYARDASTRELRVIIACAGGSAHLPGMVASETLLPVLGVAPKKTDEHAVGSMIAMPAGKPLAYLGGGSEPGKNAGAVNAALFAARILSFGDINLTKRLVAYDNQLASDVPYSAHG